MTWILVAHPRQTSNCPPHVTTMMNVLMALLANTPVLPKLASTCAILFSVDQTRNAYQRTADLSASVTKATKAILMNLARAAVHLCAFSMATANRMRFAHFTLKASENVRASARTSFVASTPSAEESPMRPFANVDPTLSAMLTTSNRVVNRWFTAVTMTLLAPTFSHADGWTLVRKTALTSALIFTAD